MKLDGILHYDKMVYVASERLWLSYRMFKRDETTCSSYCLSIALIGDDEYDECILWDITSSLDVAQRLWILFTEELVTPCTAADVLEDLLSDFDFLYGK